MCIAVRVACAHIHLPVVWHRRAFDVISERQHTSAVAVGTTRGTTLQPHAAAAAPPPLLVIYIHFRGEGAKIKSLSIKHTRQSQSLQSGLAVHPVIHACMNRIGGYYACIFQNARVRSATGDTRRYRQPGRRTEHAGFMRPKW